LAISDCFADIMRKRNAMTEQSNQLVDLFAACWKDEALKQRFMSDPRVVLAEYGIDVPDGMDVNVVENTDNTVHITLPMKPSDELSDDELSDAAGGLQDESQMSWASTAL